jgi:hypothetical protein
MPDVLGLPMRADTENVVKELARQQAESTDRGDSVVWQLLFELEVFIKLNEFGKQPLEDQQRVLQKLLGLSDKARALAILEKVSSKIEVPQATRQFAFTLLELLQQARDKPVPYLLEWFTGVVERIDDKQGIAYVSLKDSEGREHVAQLDANKFRTQNIGEEGLFFCVLKAVGEETEVIILPRKERELNREQWEEIQASTRKIFATYSEGDNDDDPAPEQSPTSSHP